MKTMIRNHEYRNGRVVGKPRPVGADAALLTRSYIQLRNATGVGLVPAILEGMLIYGVEPTINKWILAQAMLFWFTCGFVVFIIDIKISEIFKAVIFTVFLNLPWYIAESVVKEKPEHLVPLIIASVIQGLIIGFLSKKMKKHQSNI